MHLKPHAVPKAVAKAIAVTLILYNISRYLVNAAENQLIQFLQTPQELRVIDRRIKQVFIGPLSLHFWRYCQLIDLRHYYIL